MPWITANEAAKILGISPAQVRHRDRYRATRRRDPEDGLWRYWVPAIGEPEAPGDQGTRKSKPVLIASIWDVHIPDHDPGIWETFLDWGADAKIDWLIIGGDFLEAQSCSQHGDFHVPALQDDVDAGRKALEELREVFPSQRICFFPGNHETRLQRITGSRLPQHIGVLEWPALLDLESLRIEWVEEPLRVGDVAFLHGQYTSKYHAARHLDQWRTSVCYGHTHRPQTFFRGVGLDGALLSAHGMPCMRTLQPDWLGGRPSGWAHGWGYHVLDGDVLHTQMLVAKGGRVAFGSRIYGG